MRVADVELLQEVKTFCTTAATLFRAGPEQDDRDRFHDDLGIEPERPVVDILEIELHPFAEARDLVASADLPEAGEAGFHREPAPLRGGFEFLHFVEGQWTRSHETH